MTQRQRQRTSRFVLMILYLGSMFVALIGAALFYVVVGFAGALPPSNVMFPFIWVISLAPFVIFSFVMIFAPILVYLLERSDRR
ncbi:MAG: hypothetical protein AAF225_13990 [Pseudomonadota bacterium]